MVLYATHTCPLLPVLPFPVQLVIELIMQLELVYGPGLRSSTVRQTVEAWPLGTGMQNSSSFFLTAFLSRNSLRNWYFVKTSGRVVWLRVRQKNQTNA